jgi:8-oxo-dGTP pyrophosphatase MutT (NUDIX family)
MKCHLEDAAHPLDEKFSEEIERYWRRRTAEDPNAFSETFYGVESLEWDNRELSFRGFTSSYAAFQYAKDCRVYSAVGGTQNPLGVSAVITTADHMIILCRRREIFPAAGKWYFPGGAINADVDLASDGLSVEKCILREIAEELPGVPLVPHSGFALGLSYKTDTPHPELHLSFRTTLTSREIDRISAEIVQLSDEFDAVRFVSTDQDALSTYLSEGSEIESLCSPCRAGLILYLGTTAGGEKVRRWAKSIGMMVLHESICAHDGLLPS